MITNATITRVDVPAAPSTGGTPAWTNGGTVAVRCSMQKVSGRQRYAIGQAISDATAVLFVPRAEAVAAGVATGLVAGARVVVTLDGESAKTLRIEYAEPLVKAGGLSHYEIYGRAL